jgi:hypothetical protein
MKGEGNGDGPMVVRIWESRTDELVIILGHPHRSGDLKPAIWRRKRRAAAALGKCARESELSRRACELMTLFID